MKRETIGWLVLTVLIAGLLIGYADTAYASTGSGGGGLPYESALGKLRDSATGPYGFSVSIIGIVAAGAMLIFGGDVSGFFRTMTLLVLVIALLVGSVNLLQTLFGVGATVAFAPGAVVSTVAQST